ncbi:HD domain-containing protein [Corallococcus sp. bb12-1]|uniref:HD domain-containing protein n=1 Tax=Corallococcus sp. bb12-1 TaxID=2996784 RepID=UPI002271522E|nr:HD domain-containing protein [Corallococcus sp. bb12-1]MCY1041125.1 HD domain-containing protein [Corallococcus sp. bb12-1]
METDTKVPALQSLLALLHLAEKLKSELRHSWLASGRQESVAEHTWRAALMVLLLHRHLEQPVDLERTLRMMLIHDLVEAEAGDIPVFETGDRKEQKQENERRAIEKMRHLLGGAAGDELAALWFEFEDATTPEARFAQSIDKIEAQLQHNEASLDTWLHVEKLRVFHKLDKYVAFDPAMLQFLGLIKQEAFDKMRDAGEDLESLRREAQAS